MQNTAVLPVISEVKWEIEKGETAGSWQIAGTAYGYDPDEDDDGDDEPIGSLSGLIVPNATKARFFDAHDAVDGYYCHLAEFALAADLLTVARNPLSIGEVECSEGYQGRGVEALLRRTMLYALTTLPLVWDVAITQVYSTPESHDWGGLGLTVSVRDDFDVYFFQGGRGSIASACQPRG